MYQYTLPKILVFPLNGEEGFELREKAVKFVAETKVRGAEAGNVQEQTYGILAQMVIRKELGMSLEPDDEQSMGFDLETPNGIKIDVKCRGGTLPFKELYDGSGDLQREAKHNLFARQLDDERLDTDIYLLTHLETPKPPTGQKTTLPGTKRQRKWNLYVGGWVSKNRVKNEGVYLPRGAITERGSGWFPYRSNDIEFYNQHLNGLNEIKDLLTIEEKDVTDDENKDMNLHLTSVDAIRIGVDLVGHGIIKKDIVEYLYKELNINSKVPPILHPNQHYHLLKWLKDKGKVSDEDIDKLKEVMQEEAYSE